MKKKNKSQNNESNMVQFELKDSYNKSSKINKFFKLVLTYFKLMIKELKSFKEISINLIHLSF